MLLGIFERLLSAAGDLEEEIGAYDPRSYGLGELLKLLASGV